MLRRMRWLAFVVVMALSISGIRQLPWPGWAQVALAVAVNLLAGALLFGSGDRDESATRPEP